MCFLRGTGWRLQNSVEMLWEQCPYPASTLWIREFLSSYRLEFLLQDRIYGRRIRIARNAWLGIHAGQRRLEVFNFSLEHSYHPPPFFHHLLQSSGRFLFSWNLEGNQECTTCVQEKGGDGERERGSLKRFVRACTGKFVSLRRGFDTSGVGRSSTKQQQKSGMYILRKIEYIYPCMPYMASPTARWAGLPPSKAILSTLCQNGLAYLHFSRPPPGLFHLCPHLRAPLVAVAVPAVSTFSVVVVGILDLFSKGWGRLFCLTLFFFFFCVSSFVRGRRRRSICYFDVVPAAMTGAM